MLISKGRSHTARYCCLKAKRREQRELRKLRLDLLLFDGIVGRGGGGGGVGRAAATAVEGDFLGRLRSGGYQADHKRRVGKMLEDIARLGDQIVRGS